MDGPATVSSEAQRAAPAETRVRRPATAVASERMSPPNGLKFRLGPNIVELHMGRIRWRKGAKFSPFVVYRRDTGMQSAERARPATMPRPAAGRIDYGCSYSSRPVKTL